MGDLFIDSSTKGFTGISTAANQAAIQKGDMSPGLTKLLEAVRDASQQKGPVEINIAVSGSEKRIFTINVDDLGEIQEILQWTVGR